MIMNKYIDLYKFVLIVLVAFHTGFLSNYACAKSDKQAMFSKPERAVEALKAALRENNIPALLNLFGHQYESNIDTQDKAAEKVRRKLLSNAISEQYKLESTGSNKKTILVGKNDWPFSIPLIKNEDGWYFDTEAGIEEILNRRIGHNELAAISACDAIYDAQVKYAKSDHDNDGVLEFAREIKSKTGQRNGLYWEIAEGAARTEISPLKEFVTDAGDFIDTKSSSKVPYKGYYFKVFLSQGENAAGGKYNYVINNNMISGFAVIAWPAEYANTGIMTFMMSHEGTILEKDLGINTNEQIIKMDSFNPDKSWKPVRLEGN